MSSAKQRDVSVPTLPHTRTFFPSGYHRAVEMVANAPWSIYCGVPGPVGYKKSLGGEE